MTIYVVVETTGGWSGSDTYTTAHRAFTNEQAADDYVAATTQSRRDNLWHGEVFAVELEDEGF